MRGSTRLEALSGYTPITPRSTEGLAGRRVPEEKDFQNDGVMFVVCCCSILVCGYLAFRILWGFVLSVEALFGICLGSV